MIGINFPSTLTPLAANASVYSNWHDVSGAGDVPIVFVTALSDAAGYISIRESENPTDESQATITGGAAVGASQNTLADFTISKRFVQVVYTNGATAQTTFTIGANIYKPNSDMTTNRLLALILRELRVHNVLLRGLREPYSSSANIPVSLDQIQI